MKISIAKTAGFCMGVRRAVDMALLAANKYEPPVYTFGPLIHNPQFLELLAEKNISVLNEIPESGTGTVLIRAHGVPPHVQKGLKTAGFKVIDATCPKVKKVQVIIEKNVNKGHAAIILGNKHHAEVIGLLGYAGDKGYTVSSLDELKALPTFEKAIVISQTTQDIALFEDINTWLKENRPHYKVINTICPATKNRQTEVEQMAQRVDAMVVIGGFNSGNTKRLAQVAEKNGCPAFHVETDEDLDIDKLIHNRHIGITAGASTPNWITKEVYRTIEAAHYQSKGRIAGFLFLLLHLILFTNFYLALGAAAVCYATAVILQITISPLYIVIGMLYVFSMHTLNRLTDIDEDHYNDPYRAGFYQRNLMILGIFSVGVAMLELVFAAILGVLPFGIMLFMTALGVGYNVNLVPGWFPSVAIRRLKDIPGSKTVIVPMAWSIVLCLLPAMSTPNWFNPSTFAVALLMALGIFCRCAFFDVVEMQGNRITGRETIPTLIGSELTMGILGYCLAVLFVGILGACLLGLVSPFGYLLLVFPIFCFFMFLAYSRGSLHSGLFLEFMVDSVLILAGIVALLWSFFT